MNFKKKRYKNVFCCVNKKRQKNMEIAKRSFDLLTPRL